MFYTLASHGVRSLTSNRGTFAAAVATGAVVIALTASVLRLPWTLLLKPLPYERPARLVMLWQQPRQTPDPLRGLVTPGVLLDWIARQQVFSEVAAAELWDGNPTAWVDLVSGPPERLRGALVTPNFFRVLGVSPLRGHWPETGAEASVLLGYDLWQRRFGGDPNIVGQPLTLILGRGARRTPRQFTIAGVLPKGIQFTYPRATEIWLPLPWQDVRSATPQEVKYEVVGRLRSGVSRDDAARHMRTIVESSSPDLSWFTESETVRIESMVEYVVGSARRPLALLSGLAIALLAVGAVNMTTLVLLLAERRRRETAMHVVLGATTRTLLAGAGVQIATIVLAAATAGAVLSVPVLALVDAFLARSLPRTAELRAIDMALPALLALSLVGAIVIGFSPALIVRSRDVRADLTASATSTSSARTYRWRRLLLALHVSLLFGLSLAATFAITSLWRAQNADMGFDGAGIHVAETRLIGQRYPPKDKDARRRVRQGLVDRVRAEPGVIAAATSSALPLRGTDWLWIIRIPDSAASFSANGRQVDPAFFDVLQVRLVAGRFFDKHDDAANEQVAIVSTALASRLFGSAAAVGREVVVSGRPRRIVGVVEDLRYVARWEPPYPAIYVPVEQDESELVCLAVKSQLPDQRVASLLRQALASVDPLQPMEGPTRLSAILAESMSERQFVMLTTVAFACTALVLAVVGVHAGVSRRIADRRRELGIRAALGARPEDLRWLMARGELAPLIGGIALGGVTCYVIGHYIDGTQYGVDPGSVSVYAYVAAGVVAIGAAALMASTWRMNRFDVVSVLRN